MRFLKWLTYLSSEFEFALTPYTTSLLRLSVALFRATLGLKRDEVHGVTANPGDSTLQTFKSYLTDLVIVLPLLKQLDVVIA